MVFEHFFMFFKAWCSIVRHRLCNEETFVLLYYTLVLNIYFNICSTSKLIKTKLSRHSKTGLRMVLARLEAELFEFEVGTTFHFIFWLRLGRIFEQYFSVLIYLPNDTISYVCLSIVCPILLDSIFNSFLVSCFS